MAAHIAELHAIILAAAKHLNIVIPSPNGERVPETKFNIQAIRPKDDGYDEETTVEHRASFGPAESTMKNLCDDCTTFFGLEIPSSRIKIWSQNRSPSGEGLHPLVEWSLDRSISKNVREYGYTAEGYLCTFDSAEAPSQRDDGTRTGISFTDHIVSNSFNLCGCMS